MLRNVELTRPDQMWSADITYVPLRHGFLYLAAVLDWYSRYVLAWRLSNTLEGSFASKRWTRLWRWGGLRFSTASSAAAATLLLLQGVHPKIVSERLGRATVELTLNTYSHVLPTLQRDAADKLNALFG